MYHHGFLEASCGTSLILEGKMILGRREIRPGKVGVSQIQCRMGGQGGCAYQLSLSMRTRRPCLARNSNILTMLRTRSKIKSNLEWGGVSEKVMTLHSVGDSLCRWAVAPNETPKNLWPISFISAAHGTVQSKLRIRLKDDNIRTEIFDWIYL